MRDIVQIRNPKTDRYAKIDRSTGKILSIKKSPGKYKNIKVARKKDAMPRMQKRRAKK